MTGQRFIDTFDQRVQQMPDRVILRDVDTSYTFRELDVLSARVYAYLLQQGIGREDVVTVALPRSARILVAILGIWKAGAAMHAVEWGTPQERVDYMVRDCHSSLVITSEIWEQIEATPPLMGHQPTDSHDAAMVIYTSGSEGTPKGVLHEYGKLDILPYSCTIDGTPFFSDKDIYGLWFPVSSVLSGFISAAVTACTVMDVMPSSIIRNPEAIVRYINEHQITITGLIPTFFSYLVGEMPSLRTILIGAEVVRNVYSEKGQLANFYAQTESGATVFTFNIDKKYNVTPIGKPTAWVQPCLLDDDDKPVPPGTMGELCYPNPYTRGYLNDPERTAQAFRNGIYHTGDIARINEHEDYVILGRKTDMVKINGHRIEPAEIEAALRNVLGIQQVFAKGFVTPKRSFICVYHTNDIEIDLVSTREMLQKILPSYMIPSYFIHIDKVPLLPSGKVDRNSFQAPDINDYRADYVAPSNELEKRICQAMQEVLGIEQIGIHDDFFLLGGDSLGVIRLVTAINLEGIEVSTVIASRTPRHIATQWFLKQI